MMQTQHDTAADLVSAWERGRGRPPVQQALALLALACPQASPDELAQLSIGECDARLLSLRERLFGAELTSTTHCPRCGERIELVFDAADLRTGTAAEHDAATGQSLSISIAGYHVEFRLPNTIDLCSI